MYVSMWVWCVYLLSMYYAYMYIYICICTYVCMCIYIFLIIIYWACSPALSCTACRLTSCIHWFHIFKLSNSIDSMNAQNSFLCLVMKSSLLAGQVAIWCFRTSSWALVFAHWNRLWSMVWYSLPQVHFASSLRWNRCRYAFDIPCQGSTAGFLVWAIFSILANLGILEIIVWLPKILGSLSTIAAICAWLLLWLLGIVCFWNPGEQVPRAFTSCRCFC